jgi:hypothetical protein
LSITSEEVEYNYNTGRRCGGMDGVGDIINGKPTGEYFRVNSSFLTLLQVL